MWPSARRSNRLFSVLCPFGSPYAEYVLFAATLMTSCIKKYDFAKSLLLQPGYGYSSILEGYKDVFYKTLNPELANRAYKVLCGYAYAEN